MSSKVSNLMEAKIGEHPYLFLLFIGVYQTKLKDEIEKQVEGFGRDLGAGGGIVVQTFADQIDERAHEIISKPWPKGFANRLEEETDPFMLIIDKDYRTFNPNTDQWAVLWFSDFKGSDFEVDKLLHNLARLSRARKNIFAYMQSVGRKEGLKKITKVAAGIGKYFEWGTVTIPYIGISIKVKDILKDISQGGLEKVFAG